MSQVRGGRLYPAKHRFHVPAERIVGDEVRFAPDQARQLGAVLRLQVGERVLVFDGVRPSTLLVVELASLHAGGAVGRIVGETSQASEPRTRLVAYPSLLRRDKFEQVLQKLVEVGASAIVPVHSARCLPRQAPDGVRRERWQRILCEAAEQAGRGVVPTLEPALPFDMAVRQAAEEGVVLVACERSAARVSLREAVSTAGPALPNVVSLFVGPEGGYSEEEVERAQVAGARVVSLGPRVLRTETASPIFAALVLYLLGDLE